MELNSQEYSVVKVDKILGQVNLEDDYYIQNLKVSDDDGNEYTVQSGDNFQPIIKEQLRGVGDKFIAVTQQNDVGEPFTSVADSYRMPTIISLFLLFAVIVVGVGKKKGFLSILGMIASFLVLLKFIIPQILLGSNPILISLFGSLLIGSATIYLSHGYNLKSHIALFSMMTSLFFVSVISFIAVKSANMLGLGSEEAAFLQVGITSKINLQGLLLGGIMLGALGVLDDVTVAQTSIVFQLKAVKKSMNFGELYSRSLEVGRDHVASLVNTLVMAYAGANMPLFLLFTLNESVPTWVTLNSEIIVEEIIRTLTGSMGLVLAVPFTTLIAASFAVRMKKSDLDKMDHSGHGHSH
jgi:uncharacterized membrane protein